MDSFRVFDNPMVWEKQQNTQERDPINLMGVIMDPFASTRRYEVVLDENAPLYSVKLKIRGGQKFGEDEMCYDMTDG